MLDQSKFSKALWATVADAMLSTDRNVRNGGIEAIKFLVGKMIDDNDITPPQYDYLRGELDRLEAF